MKVFQHRTRDFQLQHGTMLNFEVLHSATFERQHR